jgi:hypothetical protein
VHHEQGRLLRFLERFQTSWYDRRRSVGGVVAVIAFAGLAGIVAALVVQDFRPSASGDSDPASSTTIATQPDQGDPASPLTVQPTSVPPVLSEPASTHATLASEGTPRQLATTTPSRASTTAGSSTETSAATTASSTPSSTSPPSSSISSTTQSTTATTSSTTSQPSTSAPDTTAPIDPQGPTLPLVQNARAVRIRPTSAQIRFDSSTCVTASFTYGPTGGPTKSITGSSVCNTSHVLMLGVVTSPLEPSTSYQVTITASDGTSTTSRTVSFTTLG